MRAFCYFCALGKVQMHVTVPPHQKGPALSCMDYGHHDPLHSHRVYRFQAVERAPQRLCDDDGKPGDDDGNPYMTGLDLSGEEDLSRSFEPCLSTSDGAPGVYRY